ncbi:hypothetical protein [Myxococcus sp. RHSTA-1-4]|uniref:DUF6968 family protein n=1 Tax=Myxococcus sp. RHSTA-1-4 TaxID=2874601 RepID=UPI001CC13D0E|nr:hypothetical protein [Myxococcus sp. RHSTA-1-4]MBZ4421390.1 hypothetical protein [Myxococcus sp. RHSTA-1-4]
MSTWLPQLTSIDDPIADDYWSFETDAGVQRIARLTVGRPVPIPGDPNGDWYCPLRIDYPQRPEFLTVVGVGPVDALRNAMRIVEEGFRDMRKVSPRAKPPGTP